MPKVSGAWTPFSQQDTFATGDANYMALGLHVKRSIAEMLAITPDRRKGVYTEEGASANPYPVCCFVADKGDGLPGLYFLNNEPGTDNTQLSDWQLHGLTGITGGIEYLGQFDPATPPMVNGTGVNGNFYIAKAAGTFNDESYDIGDWSIYDGSVWRLLNVAVSALPPSAHVHPMSDVTGLGNALLAKVNTDDVTTVVFPGAKLPTSQAIIDYTYSKEQVDSAIENGVAGLLDDTAPSLGSTYSSDKIEDILQAVTANSGAPINDASPSGVTTYSGNKIEQLISAIQGFDATTWWNGIKANAITFAENITFSKSWIAGWVSGTLTEDKVVMINAADKKAKSVTPGTAFNKDFGTVEGTVAEGDHTHLEFDSGAFIIHTDNTKSFYPTAVLAAGAAVAGDTIVITAPVDNDGSSVALNIPEGANLLTNGFPITNSDPGTGTIELNGGTGYLNGGGSLIEANGNDYGIATGWFNTPATPSDYRISDYRVRVSGGATAFGFYNPGDNISLRNIQIEGGGSDWGLIAESAGVSIIVNVEGANIGTSGKAISVSGSDVAVRDFNIHLRGGGTSNSQIYLNSESVSSTVLSLTNGIINTDGRTNTEAPIQLNRYPGSTVTLILDNVTLNSNTAKAIEGLAPDSLTVILRGTTTIQGSITGCTVVDERPAQSGGGGSVDAATEAEEIAGTVTNKAATPGGRTSWWNAIKAGTTTYFSQKIAALKLELGQAVTAGTSRVIEALGVEANIDISLDPKGAGAVKSNKWTGTAARVPIIDALGKLFPEYEVQEEQVAVPTDLNAPGIPGTWAREAGFVYFCYGAGWEKLSSTSSALSYADYVTAVPTSTTNPTGAFPGQIAYDAANGRKYEWTGAQWVWTTINTTF